MQRIDVFDMTLRKSRGGIAVSLAIAGVAVAVAVLAGCSAGSTTAAGAGASATSAGAPPATAAPATSASAPPAASSPAGPATGAAAGAPACTSAGLRVSLGTASGAAGSVDRYIEFKNVSAASCTLDGFPGVSLLGGTPPRQIGAAATRAPNSSPPLVTLPPSGMASALVQVTDAQNYPAATCDPAASTTLRVYPPNQTVPQEVPYASTGCGAASVKLLQVSAVQPGPGIPPGADS
jgi:hypothetical protein